MYAGLAEGHTSRPIGVGAGAGGRAWYWAGSAPHSASATAVLAWRTYQSPRVYDAWASSRSAGCAAQPPVCGPHTLAVEKA